MHVGGTESDRCALQTVLEGAGLAGVRSLTSFEAIVALAAAQIDLLIVDLMQPSHDVQSLLRAAATATVGGRAVPVIVAAPAEYLSRVSACLKRGADDYLLTPFDPEQPVVITCRIEHAMKRHRITATPASHEGAAATQRIPLPVKPAAAEPLVSDVDQSYIHRFIPREFLDKLERESLADVKLGDHVEHEMTVLFSDIRDFTYLSESLTPHQNFTFLTSYLRNVTPLIRKNGGFVDKYLGDGVMALFPGGAADALRCSVELMQQLERYNTGRRLAGYAPIKVGMGMHRGRLMLGTIGAEDQMQTTVIADAVNLAARIEGMTKTFGVNVLLSNAIAGGLPADHPFRLRCLGSVRAKGKTQSVEIFECFDNDPQELLEHKLRTLPQFTRAIEEFRKGMLLTAGKIFGRIAEMNRNDSPAVYFRDRCTLSVVRERGGGAWDGAEHLEIK